MPPASVVHVGGFSESVKSIFHFTTFTMHMHPSHLRYFRLKLTTIPFYQSASIHRTASIVRLLTRPDLPCSAAQRFLLCPLAAAVYCNRSCLFVGGSVTTITRNCVHRSSPNRVCSFKVVTIDSS